MVTMRDGLQREVDIELDTVVIQVKEGRARGLIGQIQRTIATTGRDAVGFAPDMLRGSITEAARQGVRIFQNVADLIDIL